MDKDWICDNQSCPNLYRHARGEACKLKMEDMLPLTTMPFLLCSICLYSSTSASEVMLPASEEYCEATALAEEMMRPSGCHNE